MKTAPEIQLPHEHRCRITYRMTDKMAVVYYANYFEFFEMGRSEIIRQIGVTYAQMEKDGYVMPVVHASCDYKSPARYDDLIIIRTAISRLTRVRVDFEYTIGVEGSDRLLVTGKTRHAVIGPDGRPRRLSAEWMERLEALTQKA